MEVNLVDFSLPCGIQSVNSNVALLTWFLIDILGKLADNRPHLNLYRQPSIAVDR